MIKAVMIKEELIDAILDAMQSAYKKEGVEGDFALFALRRHYEKWCPMDELLEDYEKWCGQ